MKVCQLCGKRKRPWYSPFRWCLNCRINYADWEPPNGR